MIINSLDATHIIVQTPLCAKVLDPVIFEPGTRNIYIGGYRYTQPSEETTPGGASENHWAQRAFLLKLINKEIFYGIENLVKMVNIIMQLLITGGKDMRNLMAYAFTLQLVIFIV